MIEPTVLKKKLDASCLPRGYKQQLRARFETSGTIEELDHSIAEARIDCEPPWSPRHRANLQTTTEGETK